MPDQLREALTDACLRYVRDRGSGVRRRRSGKGFTYVDVAGKTLRDEPALRRIRSLVIPPAWEDVWICPIPDGHIQATGRDARGRKQYRYHPRWHALRSDRKFGRITDFARMLPRIRSITERHLREKRMSRDRVLAGVVRILENTLIRTGCEEYARDNDSYGLATIRRRHVDVNGSTARFEFRGKSGQDHVIHIDDPRLVKVIRRCHELPGHELFKYVGEDGDVYDVGSGDINDYIREISGSNFTAKDFRTWGGTISAAVELRSLGYGRTKAQQKKNLVEAVRRVAARLRNRPATCRNYYIHPAVIEAYQSGELTEQLGCAAGGKLAGKRAGNGGADRRTAGRVRKVRAGIGSARAKRGLSADELAILRLLEGVQGATCDLAPALRESVRGRRAARNRPGRSTETRKAG